jgi:hypothetical protein
MWGMDCVGDHAVDGRPLRMLVVLDKLTASCHTRQAR